DVDAEAVNLLDDDGDFRLANELRQPFGELLTDLLAGPSLDAQVIHERDGDFPVGSHTNLEVERRLAPHADDEHVFDADRVVGVGRRIGRLGRSRRRREQPYDSYEGPPDPALLHDAPSPAMPMRLRSVWPDQGAVLTYRPDRPT